ncbi:ATPase family AAA domain-containing protein 1 [Nilaparvata lugens]|uniref:ATPase family AAA domain-containing protein 1 n=1 Tax=Nilaparvata lugens TaxID=108931 RepID=UPI000B9888F6|nr:ATPase family AAA domain-containing protein 1 [Nilaparvata lugens]
MSDQISKREIIGAILRLSLLAAISYFSAKFLIKRLDPTRDHKKDAKKRAAEQFRRLGIKDVDLTDYEMVIASHLVDPADIPVSWNNIAGLENVIEELKETVILPIQRKDLFSDSRLTHAPKGVLMHGPPGCGKTLIAKATAKEAGTRFINLDVSILTDKWYGESQKLASAVFSLAVKIQPCIIFIDEIDSFLRNRNSHDHEATAMMKAQFMALWDGLNTDASCTVIVMGATNRPHDLDRAILRRMPATFHISLPNEVQRKQILELILKSEPIAEDVNLVRLAQMTDGFSGSDLRELCRNASMYRVRDFMRSSNNTSNKEASSAASSSGSGTSAAHNNASGDSSDGEFHDSLRPITMADLSISFSKMRESKVHCGNIPID